MNISSFSSDREVLTECVQRATNQGIQNLSDAELFSLIFSVPPAQKGSRRALTFQKRAQTLKNLMQCITEHGGINEVIDSHLLSLAYREEEEQGIYFVWQIRALVEFSRRLNWLPLRTQIRSMYDIVALAGPLMQDLTHEEMRVLLLDTKNNVIENVLLYRGTVDSSVVRVAEMLRPAILRQCPRLALVHNHPSGDPSPSPEDLEVTRQVINASRMLDIEFIDHVIIGNPHSLSIKEKHSSLW